MGERRYAAQTSNGAAMFCKPLPALRLLRPSRQYSSSALVHHARALSGLGNKPQQQSHSLVDRKPTVDF